VRRALLEVIKTPAAEQDLIDIWLYTATQWGDRQADNYIDRLEEAMLRLLRHPEIGVDCDELRAGYRRTGAGRHHIYYRIAETSIEVVRLLHVSMDAGAHLES
jgi:toxin ParE1/3/4